MLGRSPAIAKRKSRRLSQVHYIRCSSSRGLPRVAFETPFLDTPGRSYDVTPDGRRLYTIMQAEDDVDDRIHVVAGALPSPSDEPAALVSASRRSPARGAARAGRR